MAYILIDGYNLIGVLHKDLERARNDIISKLSDYSKIKGHNITIVFDGWKDGRPEETVTWTGGVRVIYSRLGEKADSVIMRIIQHEKRSWIIVSSDKEIVNFAVRHNLIPIKTGEFEERLYTTLQDSDEGVFYDYEDDLSPKGTQKMSKLNRKRLQALKKL